MSNMNENGMSERKSMELELIARIQGGDEEAWEEFKASNLRFVQSVAKHQTDKGVTMDGLMEAGTKGLKLAVLHYDPARKFKFICYAVWWIRQAMLQAIEDAGNE